MKIRRAIQATVLSLLFLVGASGAAGAQEKLVSRLEKTPEEASGAVRNPAAGTVPGDRVKIDRKAGLVRITGRLNLKRLIENLQAAEGLGGADSTSASRAD